MYNLFVPLLNNLKLLVGILSIINCILFFMNFKVSIIFFFNIIPSIIQYVCKILVILVVYSLFLSSSMLLKKSHLGVSFEKSYMVQLVNSRKGAQHANTRILNTSLYKLHPFKQIKKHIKRKTLKTLNLVN